MHQRVIISPDQEVTDTDFVRLGRFPQDGGAAMVKDLLVSGRVYSDFQVTKSTSTSVVVARGRLYDGGSQFAQLADLPLSLAAFMPLAADQAVIVTLVVQGREDDDFFESRNYERELPTSGGSVVTQRVPDMGPRGKSRKAIVSVQPGAPAISPVRPAVPINSVAIADVRLVSDGIVSVTRRTEAEAPELDALRRLVDVQEATLDDMLQDIAGLRNELAALGRALNSTVSTQTLAAVTADLADLKERFAIPDTGSPYSADHFLDPDETYFQWVDYNARIEEGVRFPFANFLKSPIEILASQRNDTNLMHVAQDYICPKYTAVDGVAVKSRTGSYPMGGVVFDTMQLERLTMSRKVVRYGESFQVCRNSEWWKSGQFDPVARTFALEGETYRIESSKTWGNGHVYSRLQKFWTDEIKIDYDNYVPDTVTVQGRHKAQTFLMSQDRWVPSTWLGIDSWEAGAEITATIVECGDDGKPNPKRAFGSVTLPATQFKRWPEVTVFPLPRPVFLRKDRYAILYATKGVVNAAIGELAKSFLGGTFFESTDGEFFQGDLDKDLCFGVRFCKFGVKNLTVNLDPLNLDGGIHNLTVLAAMVTPANSSAAFQINAAGKWRTLEDPGDAQELAFGSGLAPYYAFRVQLAGNEWAMPIIDLRAAQTTVSRLATSFAHFSRGIDNGSNYTTFKVKVTLGAWDAARHTCVARLRTGATLTGIQNHSAVTTKAVPGRKDAVEREWTFIYPSPGVQKFNIEFLGTTNNNRITFHIEDRYHRAA